MEAEQLVEGLRRDKALPRPGELRAHDERFDARGDEEREGGEEVADPDPLVVDRGQEADDPGGLGPDLLQPLDVRLHYCRLSR